jgi:predicted restriction endonuclease
VEARDGKRSCVACGEASATEAAHILRRTTPRPLLVAAKLRSAWDIRNGVMLCGDCHLFFDKYLWSVDEKGTVVVADALLADEEEGPHFRPMVGKHLRHTEGDLDWPVKQTWERHKQLFEAARVERHTSYGMQSSASSAKTAVHLSRLRLDSRHT